MCEENPQKLNEQCFFASLLPVFPWHSSVSLCHSDCSLFAMWPVQLFFLAKLKTLCCVSQCSHKLADSLIVVFLPDCLFSAFFSLSRFKRWCPCLTHGCNVQLGVGLAALEWTGSTWVLRSLLCCDVEQDARRKRTYLALTVVILPSLNGDAFGSLFHSASVICCVILET